MVRIRFSHLPSQLIASATRLSERVVRRRALRRALQRAYEPFAEGHPRWAASFFDDHFLIVYAMPLLMEAWESSQPMTPAQLAAGWRAQFSPTNTFADRLCAPAIRVAASFLEQLEVELDADRELVLFHETLSR